MAQGSDQIKQHIDDERQRLGSNIREIESRVKRTTDWRATFAKNPWMMIGAAAAAGVVLSSLTGGSGSHARRDESEHAGSVSSWASSKHMRKVSDTMDNIVGALVGLGTSKITEFINNAVPGFEEHYQRTEQER